jgi:two-component system, sensor histidine kinase and response regulator
MKFPRREHPLILIVDGEQTVLDEMAVVLNGSGYVCQCCTTAAAALDLAASLLPDLVLSDVSLPSETAVEMFQQIKQNEALADMPVMFLSAGQIPDIIRRSDNAGGTYYLRKPADPDVLIELIDRALGGTRLLAEAGPR